MLAGARRPPRARTRRSRAIELVRGEAESLPFGDAEFDHLTSPTCSATSTTRRRRWPSWRAWCGPAGASPRWSSACPTRRSGARLAPLHAGAAAGGRFALGGREWCGSAASSGRASRPSTAAGRSSASSSCGARLASAASAARRMSVGGGVVIWGTPMAAEAPPRDLGGPAFYALRAGAGATLSRSSTRPTPSGTSATSRSGRRRRRRSTRPSRGGARGLLPRGRGQRARARRAHGRPLGTRL